ncbi:hypothetical protein H0H93_011667 [Arthromyces matolae]|nr:hypothetical protein H0H93_011667 [Arthromyces matolae]
MLSPPPSPISSSPSANVSSPGLHCTKSSFPRLPKLHIERPNDVRKKREAERLAYRRDVLGFPSALDTWIQWGLEHPLPIDFDMTFATVNTSPFNLDWVDCEILVTKTPGHIEEPFQDPARYTLSLTVRVPSSSGFLAYYEQSPAVVLATYVGDNDNAEAPDWLKLSGSKHFSNTRTHAIEIVAYHATHADNQDKSSAILRWCCAVSRRPTPLPGHLTQTPKPSRHLLNQRSHKPRASDVTHTISQAFRQEHNHSPTRALNRNQFSIDDYDL